VVNVEAVAVDILEGERPYPPRLFSGGSTMFAPSDFNSWYVASMSLAKKPFAKESRRAQVAPGLDRRRPEKLKSIGEEKAK
jgi:hypothetical protein